MRRRSQHVYIGARTEHPFLAARQNYTCNLGMLKSNSLQRVVQFDIDAKIIGIQLQLVARLQPAVFVNIHGQRRDAVIDIQSPVFEGAWSFVKGNEFSDVT